MIHWLEWCQAALGVFKRSEIAVEMSHWSVLIRYQPKLPTLHHSEHNRHRHRPSHIHSMPMMPSTGPYQPVKFECFGCLICSKPCIVHIADDGKLVFVRCPQHIADYSSNLRLSTPSMTSLHLTADATDHVAAYLEYRKSVSLSTDRVNLQPSMSSEPPRSPLRCVVCWHFSIVGDDDNGQLFTEREYEDYKQTVADARLNHRLYCSWRNTALGLDCRQIGPSSQCFCTHRYRQHATDNWETREVHCKVAGCECRVFEYLPIRGSQEARCHCKHAHDQHSPRTKRCRHSTLLQPQRKSITSGNDEKGGDAASSISASSPSTTALQRRSTSSTSSTGASKRPTSSTTLVPRPTRSARPALSSSSSLAGACQCDHFTNSNSCSCGSQWSQHTTVFESEEERAAQGRPVDRYGGTLYQAMGGITGFTSLVDGVDKLSLAEEQNVRRPKLIADHGGRLMLAEAPLPDNGIGSISRQGRLGGVDRNASAAEVMVAGDDRKERELRRGKIGEVDEMALYEQKYKKTMSVRSRTGLRPVTPQRVEDDNTRSGSGTPRRSSFNTSMAATSAVHRPISSLSSSSSAVSSSRRSASGRTSAAGSPGDSGACSASSTPRRSSGIARKPAVPVQTTRRSSGTRLTADKS